MTKDQIEALLEGYMEHPDQEDDGESEGWGYWLYNTGPDKFIKLNDELMARTVHTVGGHEGGGENVVIVVEVTSHVGGIQKFSMESRFFEKLGFYGSYYGCDFDGSFTEVFPKEKTITVYEKS